MSSLNLCWYARNVVTRNSNPCPRVLASSSINAKTVKQCSVPKREIVACSVPRFGEVPSNAVRGMLWLDLNPTSHGRTNSPQQSPSLWGSVSAASEFSLGRSHLESIRRRWETSHVGEPPCITRIYHPQTWMITPSLILNASMMRGTVLSSSIF
jgi:hypothetical protein